MTLSRKSGALLGILSVGALASAIAFSCRPRDESGARLRSDARDDVDAVQNKVSIARAATGVGAYEVRYYHGDQIADGQTLFLKWDVVSNYADTDVDCGKLKRSSSVVNRDQPGADESRKFGGFDVTVEGALFEKCTTPDADGNRKISLECQKSGDWNGPKRLEGCVYADEAGTQIIGKGWGLPKAQGAALNGFGLADAVADVDEVVNYGKICAQKLGALPAFDCRDKGVTIPIKVNGVEIPFGQNKSQQKCDAPAYLGLGDHGQCVPYARIGRLDTGNPDVDTVFVCRRYLIGDSADAAGNITNPWPADKAWHNDVAIVQHSRKTGETCWYQALSGFQPGERPLSTWRVPPPNEDALPADVVTKNATLPVLERALTAKEFWIKPSAPRGVDNGFACIKCHDSDPFMLSPYVAQMTQMVNGVSQYVVPCDPAKPGQTPKRLCKIDGGQGKYSNLSQHHQPPAWRHTFGVAPKDPTAKECVSCHRIGTINTCATWARDSVATIFNFNKYRTTQSLSFPQNHWMPVRPDAQSHAYATAQAWDVDFKKSADAVLNCCTLFKGLPGTQTAFDAACEQYPISTLPPSGGDPDPVGATASFRIAAATAIPDGDKNGIAIPLAPAAPAPDKPVRALTAHITVKHPYIGHVKLELVHAGLSAVLYDGAQADIPADANLDLTLKSTTEGSPLQQFVGPSAAGDWKVKATDATKHEKGSLTGFDLTLTLGD